MWGSVEMSLTTLVVTDFSHNVVSRLQKLFVNIINDNCSHKIEE